MKHTEQTDLNQRKCSPWHLWHRTWSDRCLTTIPGGPWISFVILGTFTEIIFSGTCFNNLRDIQAFRRIRYRLYHQAQCCIYIGHVCASPLDNQGRTTGTFVSAALRLMRPLHRNACSRRACSADAQTQPPVLRVVMTAE
jgi:hypothetical protein